MGADLEQWKHCLIKSIQLFCRNFCQYDQEAKIDGLLAITLDKKEVILVKLQEVDNDVSSQAAAGGATTDQSELLESILHFLAPSCRLLKKKTAVAPTLPSVWQPVSDRSVSGEVPDRYTFLRSLGLAPTALVANHKVEASYASRLRMRSTRRTVRSIPPFSYCPLRVSPKVSESLPREVNSEPPTLSPCPSRGVPSVSKSECSEPSDDSIPLPTLKRCVSDDEKKESLQESLNSENSRKSQPLTVDCNKNGADLNGISSHADLLDTKPVSLLRMVNSVTLVNHDNAGSSKKSPSCACKGTDSLCGDDGDNKKTLQRPKKRNHANVGPSLHAVESQPKSSSSHGATVKRVKAEAGESAAHGKSDNGASSVRVKTDASRSNKRLAKVKENKENASNCKIKTELKSDNCQVKTTSTISSKRIALKSSAKSPAKKDVKNARRQLLNKTKVCLMLIICFYYRLKDYTAVILTSHREVFGYKLKLPQT